jgi:crotonobetainyl-CoA:carnitine CoA-transferase CaiB-like acyl-CoA transferase/citrate lyase beta subunit
MVRVNALDGLRVVDAATLFAGPHAAALLGDFGAEVIKIEHPDGDPVRRYGVHRDGVPLWWKVIARNKKSLTLYLGDEYGQRVFRRLAATADVVIENFRPGTMERWGLDYATLAADNPGLILVRVTGFGQDGPAAHRPGFGTLAEAMSGLAAMFGEPDGPPMLPSFPLGDAITGLTAAYATLAALRAREQTGRGQVIDIALTEAMLSLMGGHLTTYDQTGEPPRRSGNRSPNNAPRNVYRTRDGAWVAVSSGAQSIAERIMRLVGREDMLDAEWFATGHGRLAHVDEIDSAVGGWIGARTRAEVLAEFERVEAAIAPVYEIPDVFQDPQYAARGAIVAVNDPELGPVRMPNVPFRLTDTPGEVRHAGPRLGEHTDQILAELGVTPALPHQPARPRRNGNAMNTPLHRSYLYVPAHQRDLIDKAYASIADAIVLDLEDGVPEQAKDQARAVAAEVLAHIPPKPTYVRVNAVDTGHCQADVTAVAGRGLCAIRLPKCERPEDIWDVAGWLESAQCPAGIQILIESARGLERLERLINASARLERVGLGEADLRVDLRASMDSPTMEHARVRCVLASRAAGLTSPAQSVYPARRDVDGLRASCLEGKAMGFIGRSAFHPAQLQVINEVYTPSEADITEARALVAAAENSGGASVFFTGDGHLVAPPLVAQARATLSLALAVTA